MRLGKKKLEAIEISEEILWEYFSLLLEKKAYCDPIIAIENESIEHILEYKNIFFKHCYNEIINFKGVPQSKLLIRDEIRKLYMRDDTITTIGKKLNLSKSYVGRITKELPQKTKHKNIGVKKRQKANIEKIFSLYNLKDAQHQYVKEFISTLKKDRIIFDYDEAFSYIGEKLVIIVNDYLSSGQTSFPIFLQRQMNGIYWDFIHHSPHSINELRDHYGCFYSYTETKMEKRLNQLIEKALKGDL